MVDVDQSSQTTGFGVIGGADPLVRSRPTGRLVAKSLDMGTGTGVVAITAARAGTRVTGLDLTPALLEAARENSLIARQNIVWTEGDAEHLPYPDDSLDRKSTRLNSSHL